MLADSRVIYLEDNVTIIYVLGFMNIILISMIKQLLCKFSW